jgi:hypothetical protein
LPAAGRGPVRQILYESRFRAPDLVEITFEETLRFEVQQGSDFRSLRIHARPTRAASPAPPTIDPEDAPADTPAARLLVGARRALRDGENERAIALLTRILELPTEEVDEQIRMDSRELLGVTRERLGQEAHARAEYEAYLEEYPSGTGAKRVAQRLDALLTAASEPRARLETVEIEEAGLVPEVYGSVAARYYRSDVAVSDEGADVLLSNVFTDMNLTGRLDDDDWRLRGDYVGSYDYDLGDGDRSDDFRVSTLSVDFEDRLHGIEATLGRQRRSDSGVLGRFDGLRVVSRLGSRFEIAALAGFPVESLRDTTPNTDKILGGGAFNARDFWLEGLEAQLYVVGREDSGMKDRVALGGEFRYARQRSFSILYLDYDVLYESLNTIFLSSTLPATEDLDVLLLFERRNAPILTLSTALQGQPAADLDDLKDLFSESEIRDLAKDRTAVLYSGMGGINYRATERLLLSSDLTISHLGGTSTSAGVTGSDAIGPDFNASFQATLSDWLVDNGVGSAGARYYEGDNSRALSLSTTARLPIIDTWRIRTLLQWEWRDSSLAGDRSRLRTAAELEWRPMDFTLDTEVGLDWIEGFPGSDVAQELRYWFEVGVRWDF